MNDLFENTILNIQFGDILQTNHDLKDIDFYKTQLDILRINFNCGNLFPTNDHIVKYIINEEYIDDKYIPNFIIFVKLIFERYTNIINTMNKTI